MKQKKIVYLGGCFQAEFSMRRSLQAANVKIDFLYPSDAPEYLRSGICANYNSSKIITDVPVDKLQMWLENNKPDVIIHRFYKTDPVMYHDAYAIAAKLQIPYGKLLMETDEDDINTIYDRFLNCDFLLYAHDSYALTEFIKCYDESIQNKCFFFPYGVGPMEHSIKELRKHEVAGFGYSRLPIHVSREASLRMFTTGLSNLDIKLNVFQPKTICDSVNWHKTTFIDNVIINDGYDLEYTTLIMNRFKIACNFESVMHIDGAYSHKMFQTMGCGIPTITYRKPSLERMFGYSGENLIFIESAEEVAYWVDFLLKNNSFRNELGQRCEKFTHQHYDWYHRLNDILCTLNIWANE